MSTTVEERRSLNANGGANNAPALEISGLQAWYGESHILHGVDLKVNRGEVVTLLGRNGAGRTTTLRAIMGLTGRRTGSIRVAGHETIGLATHKIAHHGVGYCPEERGIFRACRARRTCCCRRSSASRRTRCRSMKSTRCSRI